MSQLTRVCGRLAVLTLIGAALGLAAPASDAFASVLQQGNGATVSISPPDETIGCDETITLDVRVTNVTGLYGIDFRISYDPSVVEVVDASNEQPGVQIQPGTFPDVGGGAGLIQVNNVDTGSGVISYAATLINPSQPEPGTSGVAAQITFRGVAGGTSDIAFVSVMLSDQPARPIEATPIDGRLIVRCDGGPTRTPMATAVPGATPTVRPTRIPVGYPTPVSPVGKPCHHLVVSGNTLYSLARTYNTSVAAFMAANNLKSPDWIYIGQKLVIPGCDGQGQPGPGPGPWPGPGPGPRPGPGTGCHTHIITYGDTLYRIALNTGDSVHGLATRNGIVNPEMIYAGQRISVCPGGGYGSPGPYPKPKPGCSSLHVVKPGDTLIGISLWYGRPVHVLAQVNHLVNPNLIYAGMTLCIP